MSTADVKADTRFQRLRACLSERYNALLPYQKAYANVVLLFAIYGVLKPFDWELNKGVFGLAVFCLVMAVAADLASFYKRLSESTIGKLLLVILVGSGTNAAIAMAAQVVNELVGIDPTRFPHTIAFVSIYTAFELALKALSLLFIAGIGLVFMYLVLNWTNDEKAISVLFPWYKPTEHIPYKRLTATLQVACHFALCWFAYSLVTNDQTRYADFVNSSAEWFLYSVEMHKKAPCILDNDQRVAFLGDGEVLIASKAGERITFAVQACVAEG